MYPEMNMEKGGSIPPGKEATLGGFWMGTPIQGRSHGLPLDCLRNIAGSSHWQEFLGDAVYSQPPEVQNHNTAFHNLSGISQVSLPGVADSSGNRNRGLNQISEMYSQPLNVEDGYLNSSWEQLLTLMNAPSAVSENVRVNKSIRATNDRALIPNSKYQGNCSTIPPPTEVSYAESGTASSSMNIAAGCVVPSSYSRGSNLMQLMTKAPLMASPNGMENKSCLNSNVPVTPDAYIQESSYMMQPNVACSMPLNQNYYLAPIHRRSNNSLSSMLQDGFPVSYQPRYNLNSTDVDAASSITSSTHVAPLTPQPAKRNYQYAATVNLSLDQNLNKNNVPQDNPVASRTQFAPATPQPAKTADNYQNLSMDQIQKQDKFQREILAGSTENGSVEHDRQEIIHEFLDSSSAAIGTSFTERHDSDTEKNQNIDLNKTPPLKAPKRKKHRPKVIKENKPRSRKQAKAKTGPDGMPVPKRKYVRKNKCNVTETPRPDVEKTDSTARPASKSCRRSLNFEMQDNTIDITKLVDQQERQHQIQENIFMHNAIAQEAGLHMGCNHSTGINSSPQSSHLDILIQGNKEPGIMASPHSSIHQTHRENSLQSNQHVLMSHPVMRELQTEKLYMSTGHETKRAIDLHKTTANGIPGHQPLYARVSQPQVQQKTTQEKLERTRQMLQMIAQKQKQRVSECFQPRGFKRDFGFTREHEGFSHSTNLPNSQLLDKDIFQNEHNRTSSQLDQYYPGTHKKKKIENLCHTTNSSIQYSARSVEKNSSQVQINGYPLNHLLQVNGGLFKSYHKSNTSGKPNSDLCYSSSQLNADFTSPCAHPLRQQIPSEASLWQENLAEKEDDMSVLDHVINSLNAWAYPDIKNQTPSRKVFSRTGRPVTEAINGSNNAVGSVKKQNGAPFLSKCMATNKGKTDPHSNPGSRVKHKNMISVDDIIDQLECLNLNSKSEMLKDEEKALVLYNGDGTIMPYEGFDPLKRRKPRPKVDVDPETDRLWKLLMGKEVSDDEKQTGEQKKKYWEGERKVFHGRADSFIARMHLVQGDRRFSPWKGSVVDSVIGVFLTQNVTDHLSSSAFMSLVARFSPQSIRRNTASGNNKPDVLVEEPEVSIIETNDKFRRDETTSEPLYEPIDQQKQKLASLDHIQQSVKVNNWILDEVISSQDSSESSNIHMNGAVQSVFRSDSKGDCPANGHESLRYSTTIIEDMEYLIKFPNFTSQESGNSCYKTTTNGNVQLQNAEANKQKQLEGVNLKGFKTVNCTFDLNRTQLQFSNISSSNCEFPIARGLESYETDCRNMLKNQHNMSLHSIAIPEDMGVTSIGNESAVQGKTVSVHNRRTWPVEPPTENPYISQRQDIDQKNSTQSAAKNYHHQNSCCNHQQDRTLGTESGSKSDKEPHYRQAKMAELDAPAHNLPAHTSSVQKSISAIENGEHVQKKTVELNLKEKDRSSAEASSMTNTNVPRGKGRKAQNEKKMTVDWDSLRREVSSNGKLRERSQDTMDSIDYEALKQADINEISEAIKERGMNNMLAERMKDFLNRLVRDHGSIDLEWLRDAPPDKAKDYLLSIRGLGLKSVECIRLLTLHQHAFPVDTNVGRIAVRLGWVPLQPLPESLQLHLLEMYPVLESIQKYLWPRLCNLDQRTLYELHYQLITFGKVFCTKSKPNCNACPMRGECRHFASAFASSRLALPGPEEKSIVTSNIPIENSRNPAIHVSPIPLHSLQDVPPEEATSAYRMCEPIVEEPATPEVEQNEISETDIEEAFYEDPDEIPTIRLNVEEFTQNLQSFMQENMELQESDMSKALVALNPKAASIPTPKLKNVSRLRTEHQVYQLPDSHPLVKELEQREPDDPSPYLLAIWTPGETANSIQPPEGTCSFRESGKVCSEKTCFTCNSIRESNSQTVRGTLLIPCRTATRGSFPLNGTYFQVNEVFADHESSLNPIDVPRAWIWNLPRRTVYFGTSVTTIFKGMPTEDIQYCFWRGFVCVRGFDRKTRAPRPLMARLHFSASRQVKGRKETKKPQK